MIAEQIYSIAKHLTETELQRLLVMLSKDVTPKASTKKVKKKLIISKEDSLRFIFTTVFCKKRRN